MKIKEKNECQGVTRDVSTLQFSHLSNKDGNCHLSAARKLSEIIKIISKIKKIKKKHEEGGENSHNSALTLENEKPLDRPSAKSSIGIRPIKIKPFLLKKIIYDRKIRI